MTDIKLNGKTLVAYTCSTFNKSSSWDEKSSNNKANINQDLETPEAILYSRPWIFTTLYTIHDEAEEKKECRHGKADTIHCEVPNEAVTNLVFFLLNRVINNLLSKV